VQGDAATEAEIRDHVAMRIGKLARPKTIIWAGDLPKPAAARSCGGCFATSQRAGSSATPTSSWWLNQLERWFGLLTDQQLRREGCTDRFKH
jgi:hypothetical protein